MMFRFVVFLSAVLAVHGQTTSISQCTANPGPLPINTYIEGCITPPCVLPQLQDVVLNIIFRAPRTMTSMTTLAIAYVTLGFITLPVPYPLGADAVTCNFLQNSYCPVIEGEIIQYQLRMFIESTFPIGTSATIEFRVVDQSNSPVMCVRVPIRIAEPVQGLRSSGNYTLTGHEN